MPVGYHPLTHAERCQIHARLYRGFSNREMARDLGRDPATISREISRHRGQRGDRHQQADGQATARRQAASAVPRKRTPERWAVVEDRRQEGWSPEQIAGRYRQPGEVMAGKEWIYQQVRADRQAGGTRYRCLRRRGKKPNWRGGRPAGRGHIPDRIDLAERPSVVAEKSRIGDWEREPILGARHRGGAGIGRGSGLEVYRPGVGGGQNCGGGAPRRSPGVWVRFGTGFTPARQTTARSSRGIARSHRSSMRALPSLPPTIPGNGAGTSIPTAWYARTSRKGPTSAR